MTIFDARDVAPEQTRALFDVALRQILFLAECAKAVAYYHAGDYFIEVYVKQVSAVEKSELLFHFGKF